MPPDSLSPAEAQSRFELDVFGKRGPTLVRGQGSRVWDTEGTSYLDFIGGHGATVLGHSHPAVTETIRVQAAQLISCPGSFYNPQRAQLMERLVSLTPPSLERVFLCNSGTESVEAALKFARASTGRTTVVCALNGFHGRSYGAMSASSYSRKEERFGPHLPGIRFVPFNDVDALGQAVDHSVAAVLIELIQGEGGVHPASSEFAVAAQRLCADNDALFMLDEVQTGLGRTGSLFASSHFGLEPDVMCLAKGLGAGFPIGAVAVSGRIELGVGGHGTTFGGNPLACAVANTVLEELTRPGFLADVQTKGASLAGELEELRASAPVVRDIRGQGLMVGIELRTRSRPVIEKLSREGLLTLAAGSRVVRLLPPLTTPQAELSQAVKILREVLSSP